jgi:hypothetical protein
MNWTLELVVVPVADVDAAKVFYAEKVGFDVDHDVFWSRAWWLPCRSARCSSPTSQARGRPTRSGSGSSTSQASLCMDGRSSARSWSCCTNTRPPVG